MTTQEVLSQLAKAEARSTGVGPIQGGAAAAAQSLQDKQNNLAAKVQEVTSKAPEDITQKDASELMSAEARVLGNGAARTPGSLAAQIQSQADRNANAAHNQASAERQTTEGQAKDEQAKEA